MIHHGTLVRVVREIRDISNKELASAIGMSPVFLSRVEKGYDALPASFYSAIEKALAFPVNFFSNYDYARFDEITTNERGLKLLELMRLCHYFS